MPIAGCFIEDYRLDRTSFQILTLQEADEEWNDHSQSDYKQRLRMAMYLNSIAYGYTGQELPVMDRTVFKTRKLSDG